MRRKFIRLSLIMLLCIIGAIFFTENNTASAKTSADFEDLKDLDAATKAKFDAMISAGIFDGVKEGTFGINDKMNRAQFAKVAALIFKLDVDTNSKSSSFSDVKADDPGYGYAFHYIEAVKAAGITDGVGGGNFNPGGEVTKEQLATFLVRGLGWEKEAQATPGLDDPTVSDWAKQYVAMAIEKNIMSGKDNGEFGGKDNATRDLLVLGGYEAKSQVEAASGTNVSMTSFKAIDANMLLLEFTKSVDLTRASLFLAGPTESSNNWSVAWSDNNTKATFTFPENMKEGDYVVRLSGLPETEVGIVTAAVTVTPERVTSIAINLNSDTLSSSKSVSIPFKPINQYGKVVKSLHVPWLQVEVVATVPAYIDKNSMAVIADTSSKDKGELISITVVEQLSTVYAQKNFKVGEPEIESPVFIHPAIPAATPTADVTSSAVDAGTQVSLSAAGGARIYYTTDGSIPSTSSSLYTAPISITDALTIKAIAVKGGHANSSVLTLSYTIKPQAEIPTADVASGPVDAGAQVSLSAEQGASIYFTTDGSTPSTSSSLYTAPISVTDALTIKAIAVKDGYTNSSVLTLSYTIKPQAGIPTADVASGPVTAGTQVSLSAEDGVSIYYTIDGSTPSTSSSLYTAPISITNNTIVKAIAVKDGYTNSSVASFEYNIFIPIVLPESIESLLSSVVGMSYYGFIVASGGTGTFTYSITNGQLPPGLDLDQITGEIIGTPTSNGIYSFTISVTDSAIPPVTASKQYIITIEQQTPAVLTSLISDPATVTLPVVGAKQRLAITANFDNYTTRDVTEEVHYSSSNESIATVSATGIVTAVANGTTNIVVTYGGLTKNVPVTVKSLQVDFLSINLSSNPMRVGETTNFFIMANFLDGSVFDAIDTVTFEIADPDIASIDKDQNITALKSGITTIKVSFLSEEEFIVLEVL